MEVVLVLFSNKGHSVLMKKDIPGYLFDYPSISVGEMERPLDAGKKLVKELNVKLRDDKLHFVREESTCTRTGNCRRTHVLCGRLDEEYDAKEEDLKFWVPIVTLDYFLQQSERNGACYVYLYEACKVLSQLEV